jgi:hypothetical protein
MTAKLERMVLAILNGRNNTKVGKLTTGERCFVALASRHYDLLPADYADPIEAWHRLDCERQRLVCEWRGWPNCYAERCA